MVALSNKVLLALVAGASASEVTPIDKVISLIEGMKSEVEADGKSEAKAYDKFACFSKSTTAKKSKSIQRGTERIGLLSADIADMTQDSNEKKDELAGRKKDQEQHKQDLADTTARCAKQKAEYQAEEADLSKAIQGLEDAIKAMKNSKPSLMQIKASLGKTFEMAEAMNLLKSAKHKAVSALIQTSVDPSDPEYDFHSDDIIKVCEDLLVDYKDNRQTLNDEWAKTDKGCKEMKASLNQKISDNKDAMDNLEKAISRLLSKTAKARENLVESDGQLKDDEQYLKDLTARCEARANDYDQRSAMRGSEIEALSQALKVLKGDVKGRADKVNVRAFIQEHTEPVAPVVTKAVEGAVMKPVSFLQEATSQVSTKSFLGLTQEGRKQKALDLLRSTGKKIDSIVLTSLVERASADPFKKIKGLIQKLIERLLTESKNEATKKGFCDTELGKARKERDFRFQDSQDLSAKLASLEAKEDSLQAEIKDLTRDIKDETRALKETTEEREDEKAENAEALKTAKEGLEAVTEALQILRNFYKLAAKANAFVQASPVDEDTAGAGFSGNYGGNQSGSKAVLALLETISSDFDRTIRTTEEAEHQAHRAYVEFSQTSKASIAGKETKKELDEADLKTTQADLKTSMEDLQTAQDLLDKALQELEELKPTCIDTGMSYAERVKKREEEMDALKKALCILDEENVEPACNAK